MDTTTPTTGVDLSSVSLPFTVGDMVTTGMDLVKLIGPFVLLGLAFIFVPKFIKIIRNAWGSSKA